MFCLDVLREKGERGREVIDPERLGCEVGDAMVGAGLPVGLACNDEGR